MADTRRRRRRTLRIAKSPVRGSFLKIFYILLVYFIACMSVCFLRILWNVNETCDLTPFTSRETHNLCYDTEQLDIIPKPFINSWRPKDWYLNGSTFHESFLDDLWILWMFIALMDWRGYYNIMLVFLKFLLYFWLCCIRFLIMQYGYRNLALYLFFCVLFSFLFIFGGSQILNFCLQTLDKVVRWLDKNIYEANLDVKFPPKAIFSRRKVHPFNHGTQPPYYLYEFSRYNGEDVVFTCEYIVVSLKGAKPIFETSGWWKHDNPIISSERVQINTTITIVDDNQLSKSSFQSYSIISTLTIELIEDNDYGAYTCNYYNPMRAKVRPGPKMPEGDTSPPTTNIDISPNKKYNSGPRPVASLRKSEIGEQKTHPLHQNFQCFAEFILMKIPAKIIRHKMNPGSILLETFHYHTAERNEDNIQFNVTSFSDDTDGNKCCLKSVYQYWLFSHRLGCVKHFPFSTYIATDKMSLFFQGQCLCKSSYGTKTFTFHRQYFNTSLNSYGIIEIVYPVKLLITPALTHPFSNETHENHSSLNETANLQEESKCWDSDDGCRIQKDLIESAICLFVYHEELTFTVFSAILGSLMILIMDTIVKFCIIPISQSCLYYGIRRSSFRSVRGPPITRLHPAPTEQEIVDNSESEYSEPEEDEDKFYEFYLSYDDEDSFDRMVAQHLKGLLLSMNCTVFDFMTDVPYGTLMLAEISKAIKRSSRFIIVASKSYTENKDLEFDVIQNSIRNQYTDPKNRLLIIRTEPCVINGIERVPCISLSSLMEENETLDDESIREFWKWEKLTRPFHTDGRVRRETDVQSEESISASFLISWGFMLILVFFFVTPAISQRLSPSVGAWMAYLVSVFVAPSQATST